MSDLLDRLPYARFLGLTTATEGDTLTVTMPNGLTCLVAAGNNFEMTQDPLPAKGDPA